MNTWIALAGASLVVAGCGDGGKGGCVEDSGTSCDSGTADDTGEADADSDSDADADADSDADSDADADADGEFTVHFHPCAGNRTDALWMDDLEYGFVGCGTTADGTGLFATSDGGATWGAVSDTTSGTAFFEAFRVNHLWRDGSDGPLYVSGNHTGDDQRVVTLSRARVRGEVWNNGSTYDYSFTAGSYAAAGGVRIAESLTGNGLVVSVDGGDWISGYGWWSTAGFAGLQILDMTAAHDSIVGIGSTIAHPPVVYLPPRAWDFASLSGGEFMTNLWDVVQLSDGPDEFGGELWDVASDSAGNIAVAGVNQDAGQGMVYSIGSDWTDSGYEADNWTKFNVADLLGTDHSTWTRGVCRSGSTVVAVGEFSSLGDGFILRSEDGGSTFSDLTVEAEVSLPAGASMGPLHRCQLHSSGAFVVTGADGIFVRYDVTD